MAQDVTRYKVYLTECLTTSQRADGEWVRYEDYKSLQDGVAEWRFGLESIKKMRERIAQLEDIVKSQSKIIERMKGGK